MTDIISKEKRSEVMSKIKGKDTKIESIVRKYLYANGIRYRKNDKRYPGKPDIVVSKYKQSYLLMGAFGIDIAGANMHIHPKREQTFG